MFSGTGLIWDDSSNANKTVYVSSSKLKVFSFIPPTLTSTSCTIGSHSVLLSSVLTTPSLTFGIQESETCSTDPCLDFDLESTD